MGLLRWGIFAIICRLILGRVFLWCLSVTLRVFFVVIIVVEKRVLSIIASCHAFSCYFVFCKVVVTISQLTAQIANIFGGWARLQLWVVSLPDCVVGLQTDKMLLRGIFIHWFDLKCTVMCSGNNRDGSRQIDAGRWVLCRNCCPMPLWNLDHQQALI